MPLRNRVDPTGRLHAISARGTLMGNRGNLCTYSEQGIKVSRYASGKRWIICSLRHGDQRLPLATLSNNTQLFFLDEATALAAGHRPCAKCRRQAYDAYLNAWTPGQLAAVPTADDIDLVLHQQRNLTPVDGRMQRQPLAQLPAGTIVLWQQEPALVYGGWIQQWSFAGYSAVARVADQAVEVALPVLTPPANLAVLANGYQPLIHDTALTGGRQ